MDLSSPAMIVKGVSGTNGDLFTQRVDRLYGSDRWRQILSARDASVVTSSECRAEMVNLCGGGFENDLRYQCTIRVPVTVKNGIDLYDMELPIDHPAG